MKSPYGIFDDIAELLVDLKSKIRLYQFTIPESEQAITEINQMLQRIAAQPKNHGI